MLCRVDTIKILAGDPFSHSTTDMVKIVHSWQLISFSLELKLQITKKQDTHIYLYDNISTVYITIKYDDDYTLALSW